MWHRCWHLAGVGQEEEQVSQTLGDGVLRHEFFAPDERDHRQSSQVILSGDRK